MSAIRKHVGCAAESIVPRRPDGHEGSSLYEWDRVCPPKVRVRRDRSREGAEAADRWTRVELPSGVVEAADARRTDAREVDPAPILRHTADSDAVRRAEAEVVDGIGIAAIDDPEGTGGGDAIRGGIG